MFIKVTATHVCDRPGANDKEWKHGWVTHERNSFVKVYNDKYFEKKIPILTLTFPMIPLNLYSRDHMFRSLILSVYVSWISVPSPTPMEQSVQKTTRRKGAR